jgi:uridine kinase
MSIEKENEKLYLFIIALVLIILLLCISHIDLTISNEATINVINRSSKDLIFEFSNNDIHIVKSNSSLVYNFNETMNLTISEYDKYIKDKYNKIIEKFKDKHDKYIKHTEYNHYSRSEIY